MREQELMVGGRRVCIRYSLWNGKEEVEVDGRTVSSKRSFRIVSSHLFDLDEAGGTVAYEVRLAVPAAVVVFREGALAASRIRRFLLVLTAIAVAYVAVLAVVLTIWILNGVTGGALDVLTAVPADVDVLVAVVAGVPLSWLVRRRLLAPSPPRTLSLPAAE